MVYIFFDKQLKKAYPSQEDIPFLFPTKVDLITKFEKITNATQLTAFLRNLKEYINEHKIINTSSGDLKRNRVVFIQTLSEELVEEEKKTPSYKTWDISWARFKNELQNQIDDLSGKLLVLEDSIQDAIFLQNQHSRVLENEDFKIFKK